ncbi:peptide chain release factor N(5)-glutamine methyltransferase [Gracilibacillus caseinilyticus]|uniref:Release factor glutamine methyltransferase n=1 Tax=Gracilibacillus caseinilyticus TaxID=2932256 RepID=A0ABY4F2D7_9BACI|nr:peptide chain release factor N(5)-glutamine methyltransferase [Gracilibacillus caseinilyticus]UOQ50238.1 peptide chain release factor N(5)-glutamine methyltransferase [Gracilibacillus caseinilyticus]
MTSKTIHEALTWASSFLEAHQCEPKVAEILLLHELNWTKTDLITRLRDTMPEADWLTFSKQISTHAETKVPVQHLTGVENFYGRSFHVNQHVLIPRPETEELVQYVLQHMNNSVHSGVDIGTGSGVIAITLAKESRPSLKMLATDLSEQALQMAQRNADEQQAAITFYQGSFLEPLIMEGKKVDMIVSNPPYIAYQEADTLDETVRLFDPELALFAKENGLYAYQQIISQAPQVLNEGGPLFFEIGHTQGEAVSALIQAQFPAYQTNVIQDINGKDRIVHGYIIDPAKK